MPTLARRLRTARAAAVLAVASLLGSCEPKGTCRGEYCGTLVFAAIGQPVSLLPPATDQALDRDIFDQIFLRLADIGPALNTVGDSGFVPRLADRWGWTDSLTLAFHIDGRARWQDGVPVTARDVAFSFAAFTDSALDSPYRDELKRIASVTAADSSTAVFRFRARYPEMFYDATYYLRVVPEHVLRLEPFARWRTAPFGRSPIGDGPYRLVNWTPGQSLELVADSAYFLGRPHIERLIWRFDADLSVAVTQVVAGEADAIEVLGSPANVARARATPHLTVYPYAGSVYTMVGFNLREPGGVPHPILADPIVRQALVLATDRQRMARSVFGGMAKVPPGPIPEEWASLWSGVAPVPPYDTVEAARLLASRYWLPGPGGVRQRAGRRLALTLLVPSTSPPRRQYAQLIQEELRAVGVEIRIELVDPPTLDQRLRAGRYDAAIESWGNDPAPSSGLPGAWKTGGEANFGRYSNRWFDRAVDSAVNARSPGAAADAWRTALDTLAEDAPAIVLCAPDNVAAIDARVAGVRLRPDEYWADVWTWRIPPDRLIERDRLGH